MITSHFCAGTGAVLVASRDERAVLSRISSEMHSLDNEVEIATVNAPGGAIKDFFTGQRTGPPGLFAGYQWAAERDRRVLVVFDWHPLVNEPGHWRALIEAIPRIREAGGDAEGASPSLVVFVAPDWRLDASNPLRGAVPVVNMPPPSRSDLERTARTIEDTLGHPMGDRRPQILDSLVGLDSDVAEQAAAECLAAKGEWDIEHLRGARKRLIRDAGLELWTSAADLGGLSGLKRFAEQEVFPWFRDEQLSVRRILAAGVPGSGKSYSARWFAKHLGCECARLSFARLKAGIVGESERNFRRATSTIDALGADAPLVVVIDEIDSAVQRSGMDSGVTSGLFSELLTWLEETTSHALVIGTLNHLDGLDAALESRFQAAFFFDLPTRSERADVASIHLAAAGVTGDRRDEVAAGIAQRTNGFSCREIAKRVVPSVCRRTGRSPTPDAIDAVVREITPASQTQSQQLAKMRSAAQTLIRANDAPETTNPASSRRRIQEN